MSVGSGLCGNSFRRGFRTAAISIPISPTSRRARPARFQRPVCYRPAPSPRQLCPSGLFRPGATASGPPCLGTGRSARMSRAVGLFRRGCARSRWRSPPRAATPSTGRATLEAFAAGRIRRLDRHHASPSTARGVGATTLRPTCWGLIPTCALRSPPFRGAGFEIQPPRAAHHRMREYAAFFPRHDHQTGGRNRPVISVRSTEVEVISPRRAALRRARRLAHG